MQIVSIEVAHDCTLVLYKQLIKTGSVLHLLPKFSALGFPLYEDTANVRAATHQLYSFSIGVGFAPMSLLACSFFLQAGGSAVCRLSAWSQLWQPVVTSSQPKPGVRGAPRVSGNLKQPGKRGALRISVGSERSSPQQCWL